MCSVCSCFACSNVIEHVQIVVHWWLGYEGFIWGECGEILQSSPLYLRKKCRGRVCSKPILSTCGALSNWGRGEMKGSVCGMECCWKEIPWCIACMSSFCCCCSCSCETNTTIVNPRQDMCERVDSGPRVEVVVQLV